MEKISSQKLKLQQKLNRIKEQEAKIKLQEKKQRIRQLIKSGELLEKVGLLHLTPTQLYGAFLSLKEVETQKIHEWDQKGKITLDKEDQSKKTAISVKFPDNQKSDIKQKLKTLGLKWNEYRQEWEGLADKETLKTLVSSHQGIIKEL